jgi:uncharacterized membrane protein YcgQ (UPF0703/DUF1980 family)
VGHGHDELDWAMLCYAMWNAAFVVYLTANTTTTKKETNMAAKHRIESNRIESIDMKSRKPQQQLDNSTTPHKRVTTTITSQTPLDIITTQQDVNNHKQTKRYNANEENKRNKHNNKHNTRNKAARETNKGSCTQKRGREGKGREGRGECCVYTL